MDMRHIVLHLHIFKNAGSTFDTFLTHNFPSSCGGVEGEYPWGTIDSDRLCSYALANTPLRAISSHQARLPLSHCPGVNFHPIVFLRHPIDRVGSVYSFERRQPLTTNQQAGSVAHQTDLAGYVRWGLTDGNPCVIRNFQTIHLAGRDRDMRTAFALEPDLRTAMARIASLPAIGIVEDFARSIRRIADYLRPYFGRLGVKYDIVNTSPEREGSLIRRLEALENALGRSLYQELLDKNALDMKLYEYALRLSRVLPR